MSTPELGNREQDPVIAPPRDDKPPLKNNVYEFAKLLGCTLVPMFPYADAGSIVPTVAILWGRPNGRYGSFIHKNTEDEVVILFGTNGTAARSATGLVRVGNKTHPVQSWMEDEDDPDAFSLLTITSRQAEGRAQIESVWFLCEACKKEVSRHDFEATPPKQNDLREGGLYRDFATLGESEKAARQYNDRTECPHCGHANSTFPVNRWGWVQYAAQSAAVRKARSALQENIDSMVQPGER